MNHTPATRRAPKRQLNDGVESFDPLSTVSLPPPPSASDMAYEWTNHSQVRNSKLATNFDMLRTPESIMRSHDDHALKRSSDDTQPTKKRVRSSAAHEMSQPHQADSNHARAGNREQKSGLVRTSAVRRVPMPETQADNSRQWSAYFSRAFPGFEFGNGRTLPHSQRIEGDFENMNHASNHALGPAESHMGSSAGSAANSHSSGMSIDDSLERVETPYMGSPAQNEHQVHDHPPNYMHSGALLSPNHSPRVPLSSHPNSQYSYTPTRGFESRPGTHSGQNVPGHHTPSQHGMGHMPSLVDSQMNHNIPSQFGHSNQMSSANVMNHTPNQMPQGGMPANRAYYEYTSTTWTTPSSSHNEVEIPAPDQMPPIEDDGKKPSLSYAMLIGMAILRAPGRRLTLAQIYTWIMATFEYYRNSKPAWHNSIRHNLSLNKAFEKRVRPKEDPGKGSYWTIVEGLEYQFIRPLKPKLNSEMQKVSPMHRANDLTRGWKRETGARHDSRAEFNGSSSVGSANESAGSATGSSAVHHVETAVQSTGGQPHIRPPTPSHPASVASPSLTHSMPSQHGLPSSAHPSAHPSAAHLPGPLPSAPLAVPHAAPGRPAHARPVRERPEHAHAAATVSTESDEPREILSDGTEPDDRVDERERGVRPKITAHVRDVTPARDVRYPQMHAMSTTSTPSRHATPQPRSADVSSAASAAAAAAGSLPSEVNSAGSSVAGLPSSTGAAMDQRTHSHMPSNRSAGTGASEWRGQGQLSFRCSTPSLLQTHDHERFLGEKYIGERFMEHLGDKMLGRRDAPPPPLPMMPTSIPTVPTTVPTTTMPPPPLPVSKSSVDLPGRVLDAMHHAVPHAVPHAGPAAAGLDSTGLDPTALDGDDLRLDLPPFPLGDGPYVGMSRQPSVVPVLSSVPHLPPNDGPDLTAGPSMSPSGAPMSRQPSVPSTLPPVGLPAGLPSALPQTPEKMARPKVHCLRPAMLHPKSFESAYAGTLDLSPGVALPRDCSSTLEFTSIADFLELDSSKLDKSEWTSSWPRHSRTASNSSEEDHSGLHLNVPNSLSMVLDFDLSPGVVVTPVRRPFDTPIRDQAHSYSPYHSNGVGSPRRRT